MPHIVAFDQGLQCLVRQNRSSEKEIQYCFEIRTCDPSIYTMDYPDITVSSFRGKSTGTQRVKYKSLCIIFRILESGKK